MANFTPRSLAVIAALLLAAAARCQKKKTKPPAGRRSASISEASEAMTDGGYDRAIKLFEKLEARYPYGRYAQQAQLEAAYAYHKSGEAALAVAACDRFIKLHPDHPERGLCLLSEGPGALQRGPRPAWQSRQPGSLRTRSGGRQGVVRHLPRAGQPIPRQQICCRRQPENAVPGQCAGAHEVHVARYYYKRGATSQP